MLLREILVADIPPLNDFYEILSKQKHEVDISSTTRVESLSLLCCAAIQLSITSGGK